MNNQLTLFDIFQALTITNETPKILYLLKEFKQQIQIINFENLKQIPDITTIFEKVFNLENVDSSILLTQILCDLVVKFSSQILSMTKPLFSRVLLNLGHCDSAILRKSSHQFFLTNVKITSKFDPILAIYNEVGIYHQNFQIRQKSINSLQSLFISEGKAINWDSMELLKLVENLIDKLDDNNMHVVKATEQTLLTLYKMDRFSQFKQKLSEEYQDDFTS